MACLLFPLILVIDDDEGIRSLIHDALVGAGYRVATAEHGAAALARLRHYQPSLILLNLHMPVMDGWAFIAAYRQLGGLQAPIVLITGAWAPADIAARVGAAGYLAKPFHLEDLLYLVRRHTRRPACQQAHL